MCKSEAVVHRCGCTKEQVIKRCRRAKDAFADHQRKRCFEWGFTKRKRQSVFAQHYTKDGYCRNIDKNYFPSSSLCHSHETRYDGAQTYSRTNPLLHSNRDDGLIFFETDAYDGSGKMVPRNYVPQAPQPTYHPHQKPATTHSSSSERTSRFKTKSKKDSQSRRDREAEAQNKRTLKDAERLNRERGNPKSQNSKSVENIRRRAIAKSREQQQQPPPVPTIPSVHELWSHPSLVPEPLNIVKKPPRVPETAPVTVIPSSSSSSYYSTPRRRVPTTDATSSWDTYPTPSTSYYEFSPPPPPPPHPRPRIVGSYPSSSQSQSFRSARDEHSHLVASKRITVLDAITRGAATHPRVARHHPESVSSSMDGGESSSSYYYYDQGVFSQHGRPGRSNNGRNITTAPPSRERYTTSRR